MISIISIVNNTQLAKEHLLRGLSRQSTKYELILVDNKCSIFKSASQANNLAFLQASGEYVMFVHQDVFLPSKNWLRDVEDCLSILSKIGLAGVAGMVKPEFINELELCIRYQLLIRLGRYPLWYSRYGRGNIFVGPSKCPWKGRFIVEATPIQTVDELLLIIPRKVFEQIKFDAITCNNWHLHGVDYSLSVRQKGFNVFVLPFSVFHHSEGKLDALYYETLRKVVQKHVNERVINTTNGLFPTNSVIDGLLNTRVLSRNRFSTLTEESQG